MIKKPYEGVFWVVNGKLSYASRTYDQMIPENLLITKKNGNVLESLLMVVMKLLRMTIILEVKL